MRKKTVSIDEATLRRAVEAYPTPFHIYDEAGIKRAIASLLDAFKWNPGFKEYFAVKATPNPAIMRIFKDAGIGFDCSSLPELRLAEQVGATGEDIIFSSNNTPAEEFQEAKRLNAVINLDDISHVDYLEKACGFTDIMAVRYNPGSQVEGNVIIGKPEEAKFGMMKDQAIEAYAMMKAKGVSRFGLHSMIASNELDAPFFKTVADVMFGLARELIVDHDVNIEFVNLGGGIGVAYKEDDDPLSFEEVSPIIQKSHAEHLADLTPNPVRICFELGRVMTGPHGYLVSKVRHIKRTYKNYLGLDATMANLMRPGMYGAYHHITLLGKEDEDAKTPWDVTGSLCENNDKFAVDRLLPEPEIGDLAVIHDAGAHGHSMGFNYNGKLRSAELLLRESGEIELIRRAETMDDYFATLDLKL